MLVIRSVLLRIMIEWKKRTAAYHKRPSLWFSLLLVVLGSLLLGCTSAPPATPTMAPPPTAVAIIVDGEITKLQAGEMWVLVSGVDEHGLIIEHDLLLRQEPRANALWSEWLVHSGTAVAVREIHYSGPQNLRRFYHIETAAGASGWISDYYVRQQAYLYEPAVEGVTLLDGPNGNIVTTVPNVSPVKLRNPIDEIWWEVETLDGVRGWVLADQVKESAARAFLTEAQHEHTSTADE
mgnify:CR=1 FL=1